jgi:glutamate dehydrogenase/leucine dehydrogenase
VKSKLKKRMVSAFEQLWNKYEGSDYDLRTTAYVHALRKVLNEVTPIETPKN